MFLLLLLLGAWLSLGALPVEAQTLTGRLLDDATGEPVAGARIVLVDGRGNDARTGASAADGTFSLDAPAPGRYRLRAGRLGYAEATSPEVDLRAGEVVEVEMRLSTEAVPLAPLEVLSDRPALVLDGRLERWGYYERRELFGVRSGFGHFLDREDIDRRILIRTSQLLEGMPGIRVRHVGGRDVVVTCRNGLPPVFYLDGMLIRRGIAIDGVASPANLIAAEIYPGTVVPGRFAPSDGGCVVVLWSGMPS